MQAPTDSLAVQSAELLSLDTEEDWFHLTFRGRNIDDKIMRQYLEAAAAAHGHIKVRAGEQMVSHDLPVVPLYRLPRELRLLLEKIVNHPDVVDGSNKSNDINCAKGGAMRAWHQNDNRFLPFVEYRPPTQKAEKYALYVSENKRLPAKQLKKEPSPGEKGKGRSAKWIDKRKQNQGTQPQQPAPEIQVMDGDKRYTGYVEYTALGWRSTQGRIVYDYINNEIYLSPDHYGSGELSRNGFFYIDMRLATAPATIG